MLLADVPAGPESRSVRLVRNGDFARFFVGQVVSQFGSAMTIFALPILVLALTGSPALAGGLSALARVPYLLLGLPVGVLADRINRKAMMVSADAVRALLAGALAAACLTGYIGIGLLSGMALAAGVAYVCFDVADNASMPRLVEPRQLAVAASATEAGATTASLLGPSAAGAVIALGSTTVAGAGFAYAIDATTFAIAAVLSILIHRRLQDERAPAPGSLRALGRELGEGARFLLRHGELRVLGLTNFLFILALDGVGLAIIVIGTKQLHMGSASVGLIFTIGGLAGLAGAVLGPFLRRHLSPHQVIGCAGATWTAGVLVVTFASAGWLLTAGWALVTLLMPVYFSTLYAHRVTLIPDALQGRVNSAYRLIAQAAAPAGVAGGGLLLTILPASGATLIMASALGVTTVLGIVLVPRRRIGESTT